MKKLLLCLSVCLGLSATAVTPFELPQMNAERPGTMYRMSDHPKGVFVVEAYFLDCVYCNQNAPQVERLAERFASDGRVQVLDVGIDRQDSQYATWIARHRPGHPVLKDASRTLIRELGTSGYPSTYVIDCRGNVVHQTVGAWDSAARLSIEDAIRSTLAQNCGMND